ncbi:MAG: hypothetical protein ACI8QS_001069 [Planctomycetota bacterium]|jgi:hypothetical protein
MTAHQTDTGLPSRTRLALPRFNRPWTRGFGVLSLVCLLLCIVPGCTSVNVERDSLTTGTYTSRAWSFTLLNQDIPRPALMIARSNAADIQRPDMRITEEWVAPNLLWFDWIADIIGFRVAKVSGTWGLPEAAPSEDH